MAYTKIIIDDSICITAEIADDDISKMRGLMYRKELSDNSGMLFSYAHTDVNPAIWMKSTYIPLDIIFIGKDDCIKQIAHGIPHDERSISCGEPVKYIIEVNNGFCEKNNIKEGSIIKLEDCNWLNDEITKIANILEDFELYDEANLVDKLKI